MTRHQSVRRVPISMFLPSLGQHVLFLRFKHGKAPNLIEIVAKIGISVPQRNDGSLNHRASLESLASTLPPVSRPCSCTGYGINRLIRRCQTGPAPRIARAAAEIGNAW